MKKNLLFIVAVVISLCAKAQSFSALYAFDSVKTTSGLIDPTPLPTATGMNFGSFSATGTSANPNAAARFSFTNWPTGATNGDNVYANLTGSISTAEYYQVTVNPTGAYSMSLTDITFTFGRSSAGVRTYAVRSSADGYAANLPASINPANANLSVQTGNIFFLVTDFGSTTSQSGSTITLSGASYTNVTGPITFRFYGWNSESAAGTFSIDNVTINGSVSLPTSLDAEFSANPTAVCLGDSISFMDLSTGPNAIVAWAWDFGNATGVSVQQNPTYTYASYGTFLVTLLVTDALANTDTISHFVTVYDKPSAGFLPTYTATCAGTPIQFNDSSSVMSGSIASWNWNFGDPASGTNNMSSLQNPMHTYYTQGNYTVTEIVTSSFGCIDTATMVIANDSVGVILPYTQSNDSVFFAGTAFGGNGPYTYLLDLGLGGGFNITTPNYMYAYPMGGPYTACLLTVDASGCTDTSCVSITVTTVTGINAVSKTNVVSISPNPSSTGVFVLNSEITKANVTVYNIIGKVVLQREIGQGKQSIDLSTEANGSYFIHIKTDKEVITKKVNIAK